MYRCILSEIKCNAIYKLALKKQHWNLTNLTWSVWCIVFNIGQIVSWHSSQNTWAAQHVIDSLRASSSLKSSSSTETTHSSVLMVIIHFNLLNMSANFSQNVSVTDVSHKSTFMNRFTFHYTDSQAAPQFTFFYCTLKVCTFQFVVRQSTEVLRHTVKKNLSLHLHYF